MSTTKLSKLFSNCEANEAAAEIADNACEQFKDKPYVLQHLGLYRAAAAAGGACGLVGVALGHAYTASELSATLHLGQILAGIAAAVLLLVVEAAKAYALAAAARSYFTRATLGALALPALAALVLSGLSFVASTTGAERVAHGVVAESEARIKAAADSIGHAAAAPHLARMDDLSRRKEAFFSAASWRGKLSAENQRAFKEYEANIDKAQAEAAEARAEAVAAFLSSKGVKGQAAAARSAAFIYGLAIANELTIIFAFVFCSYYLYRAYKERIHGLANFGASLVSPELVNQGRDALVNQGHDALVNQGHDALVNQPPQVGRVGFEIGVSRRSKPVEPPKDLGHQLGHERAADGSLRPRVGLTSATLSESAYYHSYPALCDDLISRERGEAAASIRQLSERHNVSESTVKRVRKSILAV